jgi:hypothetical protein
MEIEYNGKKYELKELNYLDVVVELPKIEDKKERTIKLFELSGLPREIITTLKLKEGETIMSKINELNGWKDFTLASTKT